MGLHRFIHTLDVFGASAPAIAYDPAQVDAYIAKLGERMAEARARVESAEERLAQAERAAAEATERADMSAAQAMRTRRRLVTAGIALRPIRALLAGPPAGMESPRAVDPPRSTGCSSA